jgi:hypothetical protein
VTAIRLFGPQATPVANLENCKQNNTTNTHETKRIQFERTGSIDRRRCVAEEFFDAQATVVAVRRHVTQIEQPQILVAATQHELPSVARIERDRRRRRRRAADRLCANEDGRARTRWQPQIGQSHLAVVVTRQEDVVVERQEIDFRHNWCCCCFCTTVNRTTSTTRTSTRPEAPYCLATLESAIGERTIKRI